MRRTILVIEDNEQNLYLMRFLLESSGFTVIDATNGVDGIKAACAHRPDMILLDIQLPRMDGYKVAEALRKDEALSAVPILAVTSYAMVGDREKALAAGATGYIEKPIDPATFIDEISAYLSPR
jgi:CheY-like chemotaxis protein